MGLSFIIGCLIISNERASSSEKAVQAQIAGAQIEAKAQAELFTQTQQAAKAKPLMTIQEAAEFLGLREEQVMNIIKAEHSILNRQRRRRECTVVSKC